MPDNQPPAAAPRDAVRPRRLIYNADASFMFIDKEPPMRPEDVHPYVDEVAGTGVTTFYMSPNLGMTMNFPSRAAAMIGADPTPAAAQRLEQLGETKPGSTERGVANLRALVAAGHDPMAVIIDRVHEKRLEPFISFRLNEIHDVNDPDSLILSRFWREHPEWRVGKPGDPPSPLQQEIMGPRVHPVVGTWFWGALDFAVPEVRALRLAELRECCERYPIDGLDLDFQRFPVYFRPGSENEHIETMTAWVREVRAMTREVAATRGRPRLLSARVLARPQQCLAIGLDVQAWASERLVDLVIISHYLRNDFPLPVAEFRGLLPPDMALYASIEIEPDPDGYRRIARQLWQDGVDGIMLFNFFAARERGKEPPLHLLNELGDPTRLAQG